MYGGGGDRGTAGDADNCGKVWAFEREFIKGEWTDGQDWCRSKVPSSSVHLKSTHIIKQTQI